MNKENHDFATRVYYSEQRPEETIREIAAALDAKDEHRAILLRELEEMKRMLAEEQERRHRNIMTHSEFQRQEAARQREAFTLAALTGIMACTLDYRGYEGMNGRALLAVQQADAALAELRRTA